VTNDTTRLVDHEEIPFFVVQYDLDWRGCDRRFMSMNDVPGNDQHSRTFRFYCGENSLDTISVPDHCLRFCNFSIDGSDTRFKSVPLQRGRLFTEDPKFVRTAWETAHPHSTPCCDL